MARAALAFLLGACCAYVLMAERRKAEPVAGGWRDWAPGADFV